MNQVRREAPRLRQSRHHAQILSAMGVKQLCVVVNKMDSAAARPVPQANPAVCERQFWPWLVSREEQS